MPLPECLCPCLAICPPLIRDSVSSDSGAHLFVHRRFPVMRKFSVLLFHYRIPHSSIVKLLIKRSIRHWHWGVHVLPALIQRLLHVVTVKWQNCPFQFPIRIVWQRQHAALQRECHWILREVCEKKKKYQKTYKLLPLERSLFCFFWQMILSKKIFC